MPELRSIEVADEIPYERPDARATGADHAGPDPDRTHGMVGGSARMRDVAPPYVQPTLVAQAWPVQALLESMRRQYLGN